MKLSKLDSLLEFLMLRGFKPNGCYLEANSNGELILNLNTQPDRETHLSLQEKGFVLVETSYIYRPR